MRRIDFTSKPTRWVIEDKGLADLSAHGIRPVRHAGATDKVLLPAGGSSTSLVLGISDGKKEMGLGIPFSDSLILTAEEMDVIKGLLQNYNAVLEKLAAQHKGRLGLVDVRAPLRALADKGPILADQLGIAASFIPPTDLYSVDGIHPNSRGYAYIAQIVLKGMRTHFGVTAPPPLLGIYDSNVLPTD